MPTVIEKVSHFPIETCSGHNIQRNTQLALPTLCGVIYKMVTVDLTAGDADYHDIVNPPTLIIISNAHATNAVILPAGLNGQTVIVKNADGMVDALIKPYGGSEFILEKGKSDILYATGQTFEGIFTNSVA